jgi:hypothetical protein
MRPDGPAVANKPSYDPNFGIACSGGGIRSCSFASGVVCALVNEFKTEKKEKARLEEKNQEVVVKLPTGLPKFFSCVSGGGYLGSSFLSFARANPSAHPSVWISNYFCQMRKNVGYYLTFEQGPCRAANDICRAFLGLLLMLIISLLNLIPLGMFIAISLDFVCGGLVREATFEDVYKTTLLSSAILLLLRLVSYYGLTKAPCWNKKEKHTKPSNPELQINVNHTTQGTSSSSPPGENTPLLGNQLEEQEPEEPARPNTRKTDITPWTVVIDDVIGAFLILFTLLTLIVFLSAAIFHMRTLLGARLGEFQVVLFLLILLVLNLMTSVVLGSFQLTGSPTSIGFSLLVWLFSEFTVDQIYGIDLENQYLLWGFTQSPWWSWIVLFAAISFVFKPLWFISQNILIPYYSRGRLEDAFYYRSENRWTAVTDTYPKDQTIFGTSENLKAARKNTIPVYIACTTANSWKISPKGDSADIYTISTERTTQRFETGMLPENCEETKEKPLWDRSAPLSYVMGLSAAAGALENGDYQNIFRFLGVASLQVFLGAGMGGFFYPYRKHYALLKAGWLSFLVEFVICGPALFAAIYMQVTGAQQPNSGLVTATMLLWGITYSCSSLIHKCKDTLLWYLAGALQFRILTGQVTWNKIAPSALYLSDGGHTENLGLLPLLARRLPVIIIADASGDSDPVAGLRTALKQARQKLGVTFGRNRKDQERRRKLDMGESSDEHQKTKKNRKPDLDADLTRFGQQLEDDKCRAFAFRATYPKYRDEDEDECADIIFLKPNRYNPSKGMEHSENHECDEAGRSQPQPAPQGGEDQLAEVGLECGCSRHCCSLTSLRPCCGSFPVITTANQCFTPRLWDKMHCQGYAAAREALQEVFGF